ncbi:unnamed protein product [Prorocentrum cordatum]|uniref:Uncharacterized protein n=1 Tax=Prorocentrum cordatum TaxID=2364126 RepID=A0ABN9UW67_9DINO|nr:unnamed protein product [Polarella glacialis]
MTSWKPSASTSGGPRAPPARNHSSRSSSSEIAFANTFQQPTMIVTLSGGSPALMPAQAASPPKSPGRSWSCASSTLVLRLLAAAPPTDLATVPRDFANSFMPAGAPSATSSECRPPRRKA